MATWVQPAEGEEWVNLDFVARVTAQGDGELRLWLGMDASDPYIRCFGQYAKAIMAQLRKDAIAPRQPSARLIGQG